MTEKVPEETLKNVLGKKKIRRYHQTRIKLYSCGPENNDRLRVSQDEDKKNILN